MNSHGLYKIYFARHNVAPLVWCIQLLDTDGNERWEIAVSSIGFDGVKVVTAYEPSKAPDVEDGKPSAYLVAEGLLSVDESGVALITAGTPDIAA